MTRLLSFSLSTLALGGFALLLGVFVWQSAPIWQTEGTRYVTGSAWFYRQHQFGALSLVYGSIAVTAVSLLLAGPLGLGAAIFLSEYLPQRARLWLKIPIELLAGIPSVVFGLLGIALLRDWVYRVFTHFDPLSGDTLLTAGILLAVMILPTVVTLCYDALRSVPGRQRSAARSLGLTRAEFVWSVVLPQALRGIGAAGLLAVGRALGETVAVFLVIGRQDNNLPHPWFSPAPLLEAGQSLTTKLGGAETNIAFGDHLHWAAIMGLGLLLLVLTAGATVLGTLGRTPHA